jgi:polysaccharide export outer membrane protein
MKRAIVFFVAGVLLAGAVNTRAALQDKDKKPAKQAAPVTTAQNDAFPADETASKVTPATTDPDYIIGPEDVIDINVWKEPEMTRIVPVRPDGKISLPLINDVQAAGSTPQQLATSVTDRLRKFLTEPQVTVIVTQINSQRVFVVGEVIRAGAFPLIPGMTVLQALASAGGFTTFADMKKIHVMRLVNGKHVEVPFNYREVLKGDNPDQNIKLEPGDTVVVP